MRQLKGADAVKRPAPVLTDVRHTKVCYSKDTYCGHPRQTGIFNYGDGELLVGHSHAPARYQVPEDVSHSFTSRPLPAVRPDHLPALLRSRRNLVRGGAGRRLGRDAVPRRETGDFCTGPTRRRWRASRLTSPAQTPRCTSRAPPPVRHTARSAAPAIGCWSASLSAPPTAAAPGRPYPRESRRRRVAAWCAETRIRWCNAPMAPCWP